MEKTLVLFDIGGVQMQLDYMVMLKELGRLAGIGPEEAKARYVKSDAENDLMRGAITPGEYFDRLRKALVINSDDNALVAALALSWKCKIQPVIDIKTALIEAGYSVGNFSNAHAIASDNLGARFPEIYASDSASFPGIYSHLVGGIKPEPAMYEKVKGFDRVVFIDDNRKYVAKGCEYGWNGILLTRYIDLGEAVRSSQAGIDVKTADIVVANSVEELASALRSLGLKF